MIQNLPVFHHQLSILKSKVKIYWLLGGIHKKNDKFDLPKRYFKNIEAFIYGGNKNFVKKLKGKIRFNEFNNIENVKNAIKIITEKNHLNKLSFLVPVQHHSIVLKILKIGVLISIN